MAWLGEELEEKPAEALALRCVKDLIEEKLFDRRRSNLFTDLSVVLRGFAVDDQAEDRLLQVGPRSALRLRSPGRLSANGGDALRVAALHGLGLANLPTFIVGPDLQSGTLASVLDAFVTQDLSISAVYPHSRHLSPTVRVFVDFLASRFGPHPYWDLPL